jgi:hypothetical protein
LLSSPLFRSFKWDTICHNTISNSFFIDIRSRAAAKWNCPAPPPALLQGEDSATERVILNRFALLHQRLHEGRGEADEHRRQSSAAAGR